MKRKMKILALGIMLIFPALSLSAQVDRHLLWKEMGDSWDDSLSYSQKFELLLPWFMGTPYEEKTLDQDSYEHLVVYTQGFDCVTFVENMLAILEACGKTEPETVFRETLLANRYYDAKIEGWESRIHYFSDWLRLYEERGKGSSVAREVGVPFGPGINFISTHPDKYPKMKKVEVVKARESGLNASKMFYVPKTSLSDYLAVAASGDILAITTNISGLDVVHTGFSLVEAEEVMLVHASSKNGKVVKTGLANYLGRYKYMTGLLIVRPND